MTFGIDDILQNWYVSKSNRIVLCDNLPQSPTGLTIGSLHVNPKINTPQETHDDSVKKYAYIISIVLSTLAIFFCCIPFLTCSAYQVSTLKKLVKIGSIDYEYHLLTKEPGESNAPYTDYNAPNDVPLMQTGVEDD